MKTRKVGETYQITERDEEGLIPEKVEFVEVRYDEKGKSLQYLSPHELIHIAKELGLRRPTTQEGIERIVKLLQDSSK